MKHGILFLFAILPTMASMVSFGQHPPACAASQLSAATDAENGNFNGMSHSGTLLVLRNVSSDICTVSGFPLLTFSDSTNNPLPITREIPRGMHPGPVVLPVAIVPGAELTATLRWISNDVVTPGQCFAATTLSVAIDKEKISIDLSSPSGVPICGRAGKATYTMTKLAPDPTSAHETKSTAQ